jgi:hypothetical protein
MAISRPFLLALIGVALLAATVFAVQNARNTSDDAASVAEAPADQVAPAPAPAAEPAQASAKLSAQDAIASILEPGTPVDSARFTLSYETQEVGGGREHDTASLTGAFDDTGKGAEITNFDMHVRGRNEVSAGKLESNTDVRLAAVDGKGYVGRGDEMYGLPDRDVAGIATLRTALAGSPVAEMREFQLTRWVSSPRVVGLDEVDGVDATHVTAGLAPRGVARDIVRLMRAEASSAGAQADVPANPRRVAQESVKSARFDAWVGPDRILRRAQLTATFDVPKSLREPGDSARWTASVELNLTDVNKEQSIEAPNVLDGNPSKALGKDEAQNGKSLFAMVAMGLDAPGGVVGTTYSFLAVNRFSASNRVAKQVLASVRKGNETVVFFRNPKALDDQATAASVRYLDNHAKKLAVFSDDVANTERYGRLVENLGVTQAPAIVFIDRRGTASLVEGYSDGPSLAQVVADAR